MTKLELHFSGGAPGELCSSVELCRSVFFHPLLDAPRVSYRGRTAGAFSSQFTFQWTKGVVAFCYLMVHTRLNSIQGNPPERLVLAGDAGSLAASLDYSIAKAPQWIYDLFGSDSKGTSLVRKIIRRTNSERRRAGPVVLSVNPTQLPLENIRIFVDGKQLQSVPELSSLENTLLQAFDDLTPAHKPPKLRRTKTTALAIQENVACSQMTEMLLASGSREIHFRDEWLPILSGIIAGTRDAIRGTVFDTEVGKWWQSVPGQVYLAMNLLLIARGVSVKRIFLITSENTATLRAALLNAYIQEQLGVQVSIAKLENLPFQSEIASPMLSVHDADFAAVHTPDSDYPCTRLELGAASVQKLTGLYDYFFKDDKVSTPLAAALSQVDISHATFRKANDCVYKLQRLKHSPSLPAVIARTLVDSFPMIPD